MPWKTIDCAECGTSVPYGRLSCSACGALLASVTGGRPTAAPDGATATEATPPSGSGSALEPEPVSAATAATVADVTVADPAPEPAVAPRSMAAPGPEALEPLESETAEPVLQPVAWPSLAAADPMPTVRPTPRYLIDDPDDYDAPAPPPPASYRPAGLVLSGAAAGGVGWTPPAASSSDMAAAVASVDPTSESVGTTLRTRIGPIDADRFVEIAGWFVVVGATMAVLGFLLPWSRVVIGARSFGSYFDTWGLASPTHVVVLATIMLVLALGIVRTAVPVWIRTGMLPLVLGSLLIGLVWPYQVGPLGADVGVLVVALGGLALVTGGVVATWASRHVEVDPRV